MLEKTLYNPLFFQWQTHFHFHFHFPAILRKRKDGPKRFEVLDPVTYYSNSTLCPCCCLLALSALLLLRLSAKALISVPVPASVPTPGLPTGLPLIALPPEKSPPWMGSLGGGGKFISLSYGRLEPIALLDMAGGGGTFAKGCALEGRTREPLRR
jgi:hypothetical protein